MNQLALSLLYTTARPHLIEDVIDRWFAGGAPNAEMVVVTDDPFPSAADRPGVRFVTNTGRRDCVTGWNLAARNAGGEIFVQVSDDLFPPAGWHEAMRRIVSDLMQQRRDVVLNLLDERQQLDAVFHPVLTRAAYEKLPSLYPPDFESMFSDNWFCAYHKKYSLYAVSDAVFWHHRHRTTHEVAIDDVMLIHESAERYERGRATFLKYVREHALDTVVA